MNHLSRLLVIGCILVSLHSANADGFSLAWSLANEPHVVLQLTPQQVVEVGRERKLNLTDDQRTVLRNFSKKVPRALGVESLSEPDCSCHISSAMWTKTAEVTVWTDRLSRDPDGSRKYYTLRKDPGLYTLDSNGSLFLGGKPVTWADFERALDSKKEGDYIQLSLPPEVPDKLRRQIQELKSRKHFYYRL